VAFVKIARVEEIPPGQTRFFHIENRPVLVANAGGEYIATHGLCPHRNNPLEGATLVGYLLDCPWHHFQFDLRTGENHFPRNVYPTDVPGLQEQLMPLRKYTVEVREGELWVELK
jgi:3-phenylpropionate/trans-cinnamate dioxygenase ferredoxin component